MSQLITIADLQYCKIQELQALYRSVQQELTRSAPGSADRRNALASLENISRMINVRRTQPTFRPPGFF